MHENTLASSKLWPMRGNCAPLVGVHRGSEKHKKAWDSHQIKHDCVAAPCFPGVGRDGVAFDEAV